MIEELVFPKKTTLGESKFQQHYTLGILAFLQMKANWSSSLAPVVRLSTFTWGSTNKPFNRVAFVLLNIQREKKLDWLSIVWIWFWLTVKESELIMTMDLNIQDGLAEEGCLEDK